MLFSITYTAVLDVRRGTAEHLAKPLREHPRRLGGHPRPGVFRQVVWCCSWFIDGSRLVQLAQDNGIAAPTAYRACTRA